MFKLPVWKRRLPTGTGVGRRGSPVQRALPWCRAEALPQRLTARGRRAAGELWWCSALPWVLPCPRGVSAIRYLLVSCVPICPGRPVLREVCCSDRFQHSAKENHVLCGVFFSISHGAELMGRRVRQHLHQRRQCRHASSLPPAEAVLSLET